MGLFNIFKKTTSESTSANTSSFLGLSLIDFSVLLEKSIEFKKYDNEGKLSRIEYECALDTLFLKTFDVVRIVCEGKEIKKGKPIMLTFLTKSKKITMQQAAFVVNSVAKACKVNNDNWGNVDEMRIKSGVWRGRSFYLDDLQMPSTVFIELNDPDGVMLCIIGYKN